MDTKKDEETLSEQEITFQETTDKQQTEELSQFSTYGESNFSRDFKTPNWINNNSKLS